MSALTDLQALAIFLDQSGYIKSAQIIAEIHDKLQAEHRAVVEERDRLRDWQNNLLDVKSRNGNQAHQILPYIWPMLCEAEKSRAALSPDDKGEG